MVIAADKGKANAKLKEKPLDLRQEGVLQVPFFCFLTGSNKVEHIRIIQNVLGKIRLQSGQRTLEIGECFSFSLKQSCFTHHSRKGVGKRGILWHTEKHERRHAHSDRAHR